MRGGSIWTRTGALAQPERVLGDLDADPECDHAQVLTGVHRHCSSTSPVQPGRSAGNCRDSLVRLTQSAGRSRQTAVVGPWNCRIANRSRVFTATGWSRRSA